jgi:hypothetical protein
MCARWLCRTSSVASSMVLSRRMQTSFCVILAFASLLAQTRAHSYYPGVCIVQNMMGVNLGGADGSLSAIGGSTWSAGSNKQVQMGSPAGNYAGIVLYAVPNSVRVCKMHALGSHVVTCVCRIPPVRTIKGRGICRAATRVARTLARTRSSVSGTLFSSALIVCLCSCAGHSDPGGKSGTTYTWHPPAAGAGDLRVFLISASCS